MLAFIQRESRIAIVMLFAAIFNLGISQAQSQLSVQINQAGFYSLELNGQFHDFNQMYFSLPNVMPGMYTVRLHQWIQGFGNQGNWNVIYHGQVNVLPMQNTQITYNPMYGAQIQHIPIMGIPNQPGNSPMPMPIVGNMWLMGMDAAAFQHFITELGRMSFDSNKLQYAQFAIRKNGIYVHQLQTALSKFSFDSNRLELAKYAYQFTLDRQNYFMLQSSFSFQSNFRKLMDSL